MLTAGGDQTFSTGSKTPSRRTPLTRCRVQVETRRSPQGSKTRSRRPQNRASFRLSLMSFARGSIYFHFGVAPAVYRTLKMWLVSSCSCPCQSLCRSLIPWLPRRLHPRCVRRFSPEFSLRTTLFVTCTRYWPCRNLLSASIPGGERMEMDPSLHTRLPQLRAAAESELGILTELSLVLTGGPGLLETVRPAVWVSLRVLSVSNGFLMLFLSGPIQTADTFWRSRRQVVVSVLSPSWDVLLTLSASRLTSTWLAVHLGFRLGDARHGGVDAVPLGRSSGPT